MTRVPAFDAAVQPVLASVVPAPPPADAPDDAYVAQLEFDNAVLGQKLERGERELARLRSECDQLRRDGLLDAIAGAERERGQLRARVSDLEKVHRMRARVVPAQAAHRRRLLCS